MRTSLIFILTSLISAFAFAGTVSQVKGNKMIIQLEGETPEIGTEYFIINSAGKKIGLVSIKQIKGTKALAELSKGQANAGDTIQSRSGGNSSAAQASAETETSSSSGKRVRRGKHRAGALLGYAMNTFSLTVQDKTNASLREDVTMKDNTFNAKGFYDYDLTPALTIRAAAGYETFAAKGTTQQAICDNAASTSCEVNYSYLGLEGSLHWNFINGATRAWIGGGYSFLLAMSKQNNIPNLTDSSTNQMLLVSVGTDIGLKNGAFIPLVLEYGIFPGSSNVNASSIFIRGGYGFTF
jgi:hypothetical protein